MMGTNGDDGKETAMNDFTGSVTDVGKSAVESLATLLGEASPGKIFSEPVVLGNDLVITAVAWERGGGFGIGGGGDNEQGRGFGSVPMASTCNP
jgi:hypothetical protein